MEGEMKNLVKVWLSILASLCYCYFLVSKIPKGKFRLFSLFPIFFIFTILPLCLSYVFPIGLVTLFISWLGNFKLLLFAFNKGPLSSQSQPPISFIHFILITCLPIRIKENKKYPLPKSPQSTQNSSPKRPKLPLNWPTKVLLFAILVGSHDYKQYMHPTIELLVYCCMSYLVIDIIFGVSNGLAHATCSGLELESPSDEPYLSTSLQDFWGKRWNLGVSNILRLTVYKPIRSFWTILGGSKWAPLSAMLAAFLVSGLMHELLFYYITRVSPTWEVTWFFVLHGASVVVELELKIAFSGKAQLHWAVSTVLTVGFVVATANWLFFPPLMRTGVAERTIEECKLLLNFAKIIPKKVMNI